MKKVICLISLVISVMLIVLCPLSASAETEVIIGDNYICDDVIRGDVNLDNDVNIIDLIVLKKYNAGLSVQTTAEVSDVNGDTVIDAKDLVLIRQYIIGAVEQL